MLSIDGLNLEKRMDKGYSLSMIVVTPEITLDESDIEEEFIRASGPGGQHVNKVSSAVQLRFNINTCQCLTTTIKTRLIAITGSSTTEAGILIITARRFRSQERNRQEARDRLINLIKRSLEKPKPRKKTKPSFASRRKRLESKRHRAKTKRSRGKVSPSED